jgi:hypothetical protein
MHYGIHHNTKQLSLIHVSYSILFYSILNIVLYVIKDIVYTQSGSEYMLPIPVVITNYQTTTGSYPNQNSKF